MQKGEWQNPFRGKMEAEELPEPATMVIFGATGDLTRKKLFPALYELVATGQITTPFSIIGFARRPWTDIEFRDHMKEAIARRENYARTVKHIWPGLEEHISYMSSSFEDLSGYQRLGEQLDELEKENGSGRNVIFYLATPPSYCQEIVEKIGQAGLAKRPRGWVRIIVEKPFGHDLASARELNQRLETVFDENQVFRIDHYLGKETVQNLLVLRFANGIFEPLWNHRYIDHIQVTVSEQIGVEGRGRYFEEAGIIRDMIQNHILQLVSLFSMEPPASFSPEAVRNEKVKVLQAIRPMTDEDVARDLITGQYGHGLVGGREVPGYREEENVAPESNMETYAALKLHIDNWRWAGVPFYIRTGKRLAKRQTVISIIFRSVPHLLFQQAEGRLESNVLSIRIQPEEGVSLQFSSKVPSPRIKIRPVKMDFHYGTSFGQDIPDAYVRLLLDCFLGDSTLFTRKDEIEAAWAFISGILTALGKSVPPPLPNYEAGTWGPKEAEEFIKREGRRWRQI